MATCLLKGVRLLTFLFFNIFSFVYVLKNQIICHFKGGYGYTKGLRLLFLQNVPGTMFIQGGTFIPDTVC